MFLETAETQTTVERKKLLFKPLPESHLLISYWLRPGNMDKIRVKGRGTSSASGRKMLESHRAKGMDTRRAEE